MSKKLSKNMLSSCLISFLFGSGINGKSFPQFSGFTSTIDFIEKKLSKKVDNLEKSLNELKLDDKAEALKIFEAEFEKKEKEIDWDNESIKNIKRLFSYISKVITKTENRLELSSQVNVFTLNYDDIVESAIHSIGFTTNLISPINIEVTSKYYNCIEKDISKMKNIPMFNISKIHGEKEQKVLPGNDKFIKGFSTKIFQLLFEMKTVLERDNSLLFIIGYSGNDEDVNILLKDCLKNGLSVVWVCFNENDKKNAKLIFDEYEGGDSIIYINGDGKKDGSIVLSQEIEKIIGDFENGDSNSAD